MITIGVLSVLAFAVLLLVSLGLLVALPVAGLLFWLCIKIPVGIVLMVLGAVFCCTVILIPVGVALIHAGAALMLPL